MQTETITTLLASAKARPRRGIVLLVDDEEQNRMLLRDPLQLNGFEVIEAENGIKALQKVDEQTPDVILLDLMMPKMDGFEVCRRLKERKDTAHVPILMLTALSERKERLTGIAAGANDFLTKPVDVHDVILRVGNAVERKKLHDQLQAEREKSEQLLRNMLPYPVVERMKNGEMNIADYHPDVTVLVADLVGFTALAAAIDPIEVVNLLNEIFSAFDLASEQHGVEKIKTIGDAYMVAGGIYSHESDHPETIAELAMVLQKQLERINDQYNTTIQMRVGINTGPLVAGVIGRKTFAYDVWGDTVNLACRLESSGQPGRIQVSESTYTRLKDKYNLEQRELAETEGQEFRTAFWLRAQVD
jgi:class 3 adenylate cyclase